MRPARIPLSIFRTAIFFGAAMICAAAPLSAQEGPTRAAPPQVPGNGASSDASIAYKEIDLKQLVAATRTELPGQRVILVPSGIRFRAVLAAMPAPQRTEYLQKALGMMGIHSLGNINQRIGLDYGGEKALAAYIDDATASRLGKEARAGQSLQFYAYHVYNQGRGPALVVTSFSPVNP